MNQLSCQEEIIWLVNSGMTEQEISDATGVCQSSVNQIKLGKVLPKEPYVRAIDNFFASKTGQFLAGKIGGLK